MGTLMGDLKKRGRQMSDELLNLLARPELTALSSQQEPFIKQLFKILTVEEETQPLGDGTGKNDWIRASAIGYLCSREENIVSRQRLTRTRKRHAGVSMAMAIGSGYHRWLQDAAAELLVGVWKCLNRPSGERTCGWRTDRDGQLRVPRPTECPQCSRKFGSWGYVEKVYSDKKYRVRGHPDGFRRLNDNPEDDEVLEFKTKFAYGWKNMDEPDLGWQLQLQAYMWLTGLKHGRIIVANKDGSGESPTNWLKEYTYARDEFEIEQFKDAVEKVWEGNRTRSTSKRICQSRDADRANDCPIADLCFSIPDAA